MEYTSTSRYYIHTYYTELFLFKDCKGRSVAKSDLLWLIVKSLWRKMRKKFKRGNYLKSDKKVINV